MADKNLSAEEQLTELVKKLAEDNKNNRKVFYDWCKKREDYWCNRVKNAVGDKLPGEDIDKIFREANQYDLAELVETDYDYNTLSKEELNELVSLMKKAFDDVEGFEPEESETYGCDYDALYNGWEDIYSILEDKIKKIEAVIKEKL